MAIALAPPAARAAVARSCAFTALAGLVLACAGTPASIGEPGSDTNARERQRGVLAKTMPAAAAAAGDSTPAPPAAAASPDAPRPGRLLIYSAITGHVPLDERDPDDPSQRYRTPAEREAARARKIEAEIEAELSRESGLAVAAEEAPSPEPADPALLDPAADPLRAPAAPELRDVPQSLFDTREVTIPAGQWQNRGPIDVVRNTLDVDDDGNPEEVRYVDVRSGLLVRVEQDRDFDGRFDTWISYEAGKPAVQVLDTDGDQRSDTWERYRGGELEARTRDRDHDGVKDTFFRYENGLLVSSQLDSDNDGTVDRVETYSGRHRLRSEEDQTLNGYMDTWTTFEVVDGREVIARIERDTRDQGAPDVFETYETRGARTLLTRKEEDLDGDGSIDIVSTYEDGRLVQRAISDEALSPL